MVRALRRTVAYHLGSIVLGSFVIAIVQFVRVRSGEGADDVMQAFQEDSGVKGGVSWRPVNRSRLGIWDYLPNPQSAESRMPTKHGNSQLQTVVWR